MGLLDALKNRFSGDPVATMGWRYVAYVCGEQRVYFTIEPMASGADWVYVPAERSWLVNSPPWARSRYAEIMQHLKNIPWNRILEWKASDDYPGTWDGVKARPGSLESTTGGQWMENQRLFHPSSVISHEQAHEMWHRLAERFAQACRGRVRLSVGQVIENSVFQKVELPALKANPNVQLEFI